ncbi:hypothetical protein EYC84_012066 [Monilinia fructicola]|uniref:Uncharacterized protein n=1 Tax=Monilinia fructicola TaxID=38448 RepID=A0A5M9J4F1_MONFR|nr:hypothetical protein EYC84_012066 [Monilinia fructicola]
MNSDSEEYGCFLSIWIVLYFQRISYYSQAYTGGRFQNLLFLTCVALFLLSAWALSYTSIANAPDLASNLISAIPAAFTVLPDVAYALLTFINDNMGVMLRSMYPLPGIRRELRSPGFVLDTIQDDYEGYSQEV